MDRPQEKQPVVNLTGTNFRPEPDPGIQFLIGFSLRIALMFLCLIYVFDVEHLRSFRRRYLSPLEPSIKSMCKRFGAGVVKPSIRFIAWLFRRIVKSSATILRITLRYALPPFNRIAKTSAAILWINLLLALRFLWIIMWTVRSWCFPYMKYFRAILGIGNIMAMYSTKFHHLQLTPRCLWLLELLAGEDEIYLIASFPVVPLCNWICRYIIPFQNVHLDHFALILVFTFSVAIKILEFNIMEGLLKKGGRNEEMRFKNLIATLPRRKWTDKCASMTSIGKLAVSISVYLHCTVLLNSGAPGEALGRIFTGQYEDSRWQMNHCNFVPNSFAL